MSGFPPGRPKSRHFHFARLLALLTSGKSRYLPIPTYMQLYEHTCTQKHKARQWAFSQTDLEGIFKLQGTQVLEKGFTPDGSGPGVLDLLSAQLFSFRWSASNDSEAFDDAVATTVHSLYFSQSNDSQFKFRNDTTESGDFLLLSHTVTLTQRSARRS